MPPRSLCIKAWSGNADDRAVTPPPLGEKAVYRISRLLLPILLILPVLHLHGAIQAQGALKTEVYPTSMTTREGLGGTPFPFGLGKPCRMQTLYETVEERGPTRIVREIRLRPDWVNPTYTQKAKAWANMGISMSHSSRGFATISSTFSRNRGLDETGVFKVQKVALPGQVTSKVGPKPFNIVFKLDHPFIHRPAAGNLLVEYYILSQPSGNYRLDSSLHCMSVSADFGKRDSSCHWNRKTSTGTEKVWLRLKSNLSLKLGNTVTWTLEDAPPKTPTVFFLGNDPKVARWGVLPVPIDLHPFGATGCYLNTDILLANVGLSDSKGVAVASFTIPTNYAWINQFLHVQAFVPRFSANKMGLVFSLGHKAQICGPITATRLLAIGDLKSQKGSVLYGDAPVLELVYQ